MDVKRMGGLSQEQNLQMAQLRAIAANGTNSNELVLSQLAQNTQLGLALAQKSLAQKIDLLSITITNANVSAAENAVLFDLQGITGYTEGANITKTVSGGVSYADVNEIIATNNIAIVGFQYQVANASQYNNSFAFKRVNIDGNVDEQFNLTPLLKAAQNPAYQQAGIIYVDGFARVIDVFCGMQVNVAAASSITLTFYVTYQDRLS
jgi:hypothetical protein